MGLDFLSKTAKSFHRSCQRGYEHLRAGHLFASGIAPGQRCFLAHVGDASRVDQGQEVVLRAEAGRITLFRDESPVGTCDAPPVTILDKIREAGVAVGKLETVHPLSSSVDVIVL